MTGRKNNKRKVIKAISVALSIYMALSPMVAYADELEDANNNVSAQLEKKEEAANSVKEAVENAEVSEARAELENNVVDVDVTDIESRNTLEDISIQVENEINRIENEAIKEAADAIVNVDMSDVDDALDKVSKLVDDTLAAEDVADEIIATADALISTYEEQADAALKVLEDISKESEAVTLLEDGSVEVDWDLATKEVQDLYEEYQRALEAKEAAELEKERAIDVEKQKAASDKVNELNASIIDKDKERNEKISESKLDRNDAINSIIGEIAVNNAELFEAKYTYDSNIEGTDDIYRFYVNTVKDGIVYGCLTYYDSVNKTILRKNFSISADGDINYEYVPQAEWVKGDANCKNPLFGNGSNYIAAYVGDNTSAYISSEGFKGIDVSNLMRANVEINSVIDDRNKALNELREIEEIAEKVKEDLQAASDYADDALNRYREAVAMYKDVASLEDEIKNDEIEIAMLEYVKAEVEVFKKQQLLDQVKETIDNSKKADKTVEDDSVAKESVEAVINNIASNLGLEPSLVEGMVVQAIIDMEDSYAVETNDEIIEVIDEPIDTQDEIQKIITVEDNQVPLADFGEFANIDADASYVMNWWRLFIIELVCAALVIFIVAKKKKEEANR